MAVLRPVFYFLIYILVLLTGPDLLAILVTLPLFVAIMVTLLNEDRNRIGYIDGISLIYFISFVVVPMQKISDRTFNYSGIGNGVTYPQEYFVIVAGLALASYVALAVVLRNVPVARFWDAKIKISKWYLIIAAVVFVVTAILLSGSIENLQAPRYDKEYDAYTIFVTIVDAFLCINAIFAIMREDANKVGKVLTALFCVLCLLWVANPFNTARFVLLGVWIPVILCVFPRFTNPGVFYILVPLALLVVLPVLSITTRQGVAEINAETVYGYGTSIFVISFFDLFECSVEALRHISRFGYQGGNLLLFTVFTFVPRTIWPEKPINSGLLIGQMNVREGLHNENLAVPWFIDGYMDFGIVGSLAYGVLLACAFAFVRSKVKVNVGGVDLVFLVFIANVAILIRGTLGVVMYLYVFQLLALFVYSKLFVRTVPRPQVTPFALAVSRGV